MRKLVSREKSGWRGRQSAGNDGITILTVMGPDTKEVRARECVCVCARVSVRRWRRGNKQLQR